MMTYDMVCYNLSSVTELIGTSILAIGHSTGCTVGWHSSTDGLQMVSGMCDTICTTGHMQLTYVAKATLYAWLNKTIKAYQGKARGTSILL